MCLCVVECASVECASVECASVVSSVPVWCRVCQCGVECAGGVCRWGVPVIWANDQKYRFSRAVLDWTDVSMLSYYLELRALYTSKDRRAPRDGEVAPLALPA